MKTLRAIDLFCGAGGTSTALAQACAERGIRLDLTPINHWETAIETHALNHPSARHICAPVEDVRPENLCEPGTLDWLVASPECTHHSRARGGLPVDDQRRAGARRVLDFAERLRPRRIWVENVPEFLEWGPLMKKPGTANDYVPNPKFKGALFRHWVEGLQLLGYQVQWRLQNAANYGAPTTRTRVIVQAARKGLRCVWPACTHRDPKLAGDLFGDLPGWLPVRDCIDWTLPCPSIFTRDKPLSVNTLSRIEAGFRAQGFQVLLVQGSFGNDSRPNRVRTLSEPCGTVVGAQTWGLAVPFIVPIDHVGQGSIRHAPLDAPLSTLTTKQRHMLIQPCLLPQQSDGRLRPVTEPCPTVSTAGAIGLVRPFLTEYYGTGSHADCDVPLPTLTTKARFGLVSPGDDIGYRMLHWRETAAAQSFPADYRFAGTSTQIHKQIGNAVPPALARAHFAAALAN